MPSSNRHHSVIECPQNPTLIHIQDTLRRLDGHGERTAVALENLAANSATIESHTLQLAQHNTAFIDLFNWRKDFEKKQDYDYRQNLERIVALEKAKIAVEVKEAVEEKVEAKEEKIIEAKAKFWTDVKLKMLTPMLLVLLFIVLIVDKLNLVVRTLSLWHDFKTLIK